MRSTSELGVSQLPEVELGGWHDCADSMASRHRQSSLAHEQAQEMSCIGGGDALQGCSTVAQHTLLGQGSRPASAFILLLQWTMQPVKGILESTVYVGKTFLIWPPDAKLAAGRAADEPYPRPWALRCLAGTSHSFPVQDLPQCCRHSSSTKEQGTSSDGEVERPGGLLAVLLISHPRLPGCMMS